MSQELFEKYLQDRLSEAEQRQLSGILASEQGSREFAEFLREWTLLADVSKALASHATGSTTKIRMRRVGGSGSARAVWWAAGLAAAVLFMAGVFVATRPVASPKAAPEAVAEKRVQTVQVPEPERRPPEPERLVTPRPPEPEPLRLPPPEPKTPVEKASPVPVPERPPTPVAPPKVEPPPAEKPTIVALARVERAAGPVFTEGRRPVKAGQDLLPDQGLETGARAAVSVRYPDDTRFELGADTSIERLSETKGKLIQLMRGTLNVAATKQPAGRPMTIRTPHAEAIVVGTQFALLVTPDSTRLEVREGKVRFTRLDSASVEVTAGHMAIAAKGTKLEAKVLVVSAEFQDGVAPAPSYAGTRDTHLSGAEPLRNFGAAEVLEADGDETDGKKIYALLKWDLSEIPPGSSVRSAVITLHVADASQGVGYSLYDAKRPWTEGEVTWSAFTKARGPLGRGAEVLASVAPREKGFVSILLNPAGVALVQSWIRTPATNHGFLIANDSNADGFKFASRESSHAERRPKLMVEYTPGAK